jgi:hypothetical protein
MIVVVPAYPRLARRGLNDHARLAGFRTAHGVKLAPMAHSPSFRTSPRFAGLSCMSQFAPSSHPMVPETLRTVKARSPIGALCQKVLVVVAILMVRPGHARIICLQGSPHRDKKRHDVGATGGLQLDSTCGMLHPPQASSLEFCPWWSL